jgi:AhpD family alkylhydroperoxidase
MRSASGIRGAGIIFLGLMRASWVGIGAALVGYGLLRHRLRGLPRRERVRSSVRRAVQGVSERRPNLLPYHPSADPALDEIDRESQDGFPASDAPSWTPITRIGTPMLRKESDMPESMYPLTTQEIAHRRRELAPDVEAAFDWFSQHVFAAGALPAKTKQLIAVAVAHVTQCPYCIKGHTKTALRDGATPKELMEAIWVAAEMRAGGAYAHSALAVTAMDEAERHRGH